MNTRQKTKIAKSLLKKSLTNGLVDSQKVLSILKNLAASKPQGLIGILKIYKRLVESKIASKTLTIESPTSISNLKKVGGELIKKTAAEKIVYKINPSLVFGAKITKGDWVWEHSLATKLKQLTINN